MTKPVVERIAPELMPLVPGFLHNCRKEAQQIEQALAVEDWESVTRLGHSLKGASGWFGFSGLMRIGFCIQVSGSEHSRGAHRFLQDLFEYLEHVEVVPLSDSSA